MAAGRPVVALNSGGPRETITDGVTGFLCPRSPEALAEAMFGLITDRQRAEQMGRAAHAHVRQNFSHERFTHQLESVLYEVVGSARSRGQTLAGR